jgi:hypothetical protein
MVVERVEHVFFCHGQGHIFISTTKLVDLAGILANRLRKSANQERISFQRG